jgi:hypothetical protein
MSIEGIWAGWHGQGFLELEVMLLSNVRGLDSMGSCCNALPGDEYLNNKETPSAFDM